MYRNLVLCLCLLPALLNTAMAGNREPADGNTAKTAHQKQEAKPGEAKQLSGMSIVGNDEAPKALYIVPWKSSVIGQGTDLNMMSTERALPVDRDVFMRQLDFYEVSTKK